MLLDETLGIKEPSVKFYSEPKKLRKAKSRMLRKNLPVKTVKSKPKVKGVSRRKKPNAVSRKVKKNVRNRHHRKPRSAGGDGRKENISLVRKLDHDAFHRLFGPGLVHVIVEILNKIWIDPDYELFVRKRVVREEPMHELDGRRKYDHIR